jgi:hypothetical protein
MSTRRLTVPPALPIVVLTAIVSGAALLMGQEFTSAQRGLAFVVTALTGAILLAVVIQCMSHRDGVWDWKNGGVAYLVRSDSSRLSWCDWAILVSRHGLLHRASGRLRIERRALCGLVPIDKEERSLSPGDRVQVGHDEMMKAELAPGAFGERASIFREERYVMRRQQFDHVVVLQQQGQAPLLLLDLASAGDLGESSVFAERLGGMVAQAIPAVPVKRQAASAAPVPSSAHPKG